jgi:glycerophosphoryl diester phosphodiesterase
VLTACLLALTGNADAADAPRFPEIHAHRGGAGLAPENTLAAFRKALALQVEVLEMDLHVTRDGEVVVIHDATLERTTDGRGVVRELALEEIRRADAGAKFAREFAGERIPTLREVLALVRSDGRPTTRLNLETKFAKGEEGQPDDFEARVLAILREEGFVGRAILQSFHHPSLVKAKRLEPGLKTAALIGRQRPKDPVELIRGLGADYYSPPHQQVAPALVEALHAAGIPVVPWTVNETADALRLLEAGVGHLAGDGLITNYPDRLLALLRSRR